MSNQSPLWMQSLTSAYPKFELINPEKAKSELGFAMQIFQQSEYLQRCDPQSILNAVVNVARTSITLNPVMRLAYLIPRKNRCVLEFSYMGLVAMLRDNGCIKSISAHIVYADEEFEYNIAENKIMHKPNYAETEQEHNSRKIIGCYSRATLPNNEVVYEFMPMWEIEKVKRMSDGSDSKFSAWQTWKDEMIKKSVIKRHFKMLISGNPTEALSTALAIENENNQITSFTSPSTTSKKSNLMNTFSDLNEVTDNPNQLTIESSLDEPKIDISQMTDEQIDLQMSSLEIEREPFDLFDTDSEE
jgi:recombination protein RecT